MIFSIERQIIEKLIISNEKRGITKTKENLKQSFQL